MQTCRVTGFVVVRSKFIRRKVVVRENFSHRAGHEFRAPFGYREGMIEERSRKTGNMIDVEEETSNDQTRQKCVPKMLVGLMKAWIENIAEFCQ